MTMVLLAFDMTTESFDGNAMHHLYRQKIFAEESSFPLLPHPLLLQNKERKPHVAAVDAKQNQNFVRS